jgi:hypothetical protein
MLPNRFTVDDGRAGSLSATPIPVKLRSPDFQNYNSDPENTVVAPANREDKIYKEALMSRSWHAIVLIPCGDIAQRISLSLSSFRDFRIPTSILPDPPAMESVRKFSLLYVCFSALALTHDTYKPQRIWLYKSAAASML